MKTAMKLTELGEKGFIVVVFHNEQFRVLKVQGQPMLILHTVEYK